MEYRGTHLRELDLDAALARRPALILVDELAHTNAPGSRHAKRWQDVAELLDGRDRRLHHAERPASREPERRRRARSRACRSRETVPDSVLEEADEVELIDLPPDDLIQRLKEGKVYVPEQAERGRAAASSARAISSRCGSWRSGPPPRASTPRWRSIGATTPSGGSGPWPSGSWSASARARSRRASCEPPGGWPPGSGAEWVVVVRRDAGHRPARRKRTGTASSRPSAWPSSSARRPPPCRGTSVAARSSRTPARRNVTRIVVGKPARPRWREALFGSVVNELVRQSGDIDVYVITGEREGPQPAAAARAARRPSTGPAYAKAAGVVALCTGVAWLMFPHFAPANLIMVYLLGVVLAASRLGRGPSILASVLSVAAFDFFFVPPYLTFAVSDTAVLRDVCGHAGRGDRHQHAHHRIRAQAEASRQRERRTATLYAMTRDLVRQQELDELLRAAVRHIAEVFGSRVAVFLPDPDGQLVRRAGDSPPGPGMPSELGVARWVQEHGQMAGPGQRHAARRPRALSAARRGARHRRGARGRAAAGRGAGDARAAPPPRDLRGPDGPRHRARGARWTRPSRRACGSETERLRNSLLSSVSHDLRTPLATITGSASGLVERRPRLDAAARRELPRRSRRRPTG